MVSDITKKHATKVEALKNAGLTDSEAKIYLVLLDLGPSLAGMVARRSGIHRRTVYDILDRLVEKGLVGYMRTNNRNYYETTEPIKLMELLREKEEEMSGILPELELSHKQSKEKQETNFYKGKEGIRIIFEDQIKEGKEILVFGESNLASDVLRYYLPKYNKKRIEKKIKMKMLFDKSLQEKMSKIPLAEIRFLKSHISLSSTNIYADKVAIILWSDNPLGILIKQKEIADSYRNYFKMLWDSAEK
ncbi:MAG: helix-turn-helix domain-containing protein [Nanoarchaeota archaeon]|nr:helix-turn-helix domain-containing protein [Nanoarchaeota archaeon]